MQPIPDYTSSVSEHLEIADRSGCAADRCGADGCRRNASIGCFLNSKQPPRRRTKSNALGWLFAAKDEGGRSVKGLYIHGGVGRGKTMLMDMFLSMVPIQRKRRAHFHEFMADVHERILQHRQKLKNGETSQADPVPPVAAALYRRGAAALLRRVHRDRHRRRDDPVAAVLASFSQRLRADRDLECRARQSLQGRPQPRPVPAVHRSAEDHAEIATLDSPTDYRLEKTERPAGLI